MRLWIRLIGEQIFWECGAKSQRPKAKPYPPNFSQELLFKSI